MCGPMDPKNPGFQRTCHHCSEIFHICTDCDRWHWCCSEHCRLEARKASWRKASSLYRQSEKGKENSRKGQIAYRLRKRRQKKSVSHQSPAPLAMPVKLSPQPFFEEKRLAEPPPSKPSTTVARCRICAKPINFLISYAGFVRKRRPQRGVKHAPSGNKSRGETTLPCRTFNDEHDSR